MAYPEPSRPKRGEMTKAERILRFIQESRNGRTYGEIQRFICTMNGLDYEERDVGGARFHRGVYGTNLGSLLPAFCKKEGGRGRPGRWKLVRRIRPPFYTELAGRTDEERKTIRARKAESKQRYEARVAEIEAQERAETEAVIHELLS